MISVASLWRLAPRFAVLGSALVVSAELTSRVDDYVRLGDVVKRAGIKPE